MSEEKKQKSDEIKEFGALMLNENKKNYKIRLLTIIGEIEGHETVSNNTKATKYEHLLPQLAEAEESDEVEGVLILLNTLGGDVEAGLAIAEMIASLGKPTVSLLFLVEVILLAVLLLFRQIIPLLYRQEPWLFIRFVQTVLLSV